MGTRFFYFSQRHEREVPSFSEFYPLVIPRGESVHTGRTSVHQPYNVCVYHGRYRNHATSITTDETFAIWRASGEGPRDENALGGERKLGTVLISLAGQSLGCRMARACMHELATADEEGRSLFMDGHA